MGSNNLAARSDGQTVQSDDVNQYRNALMGDSVPRNASGSPEASQGSLGTISLPWNNLYLTGTVIQNGNVLDFSSLGGESHQIVSGTALASGYPNFLTFVSSTTTGRILGAATNLVLVVNNTSVTVTSNIDVTSLTLGPSASNTCLVNDATLTGQESSRLLGEDGNPLTIGTVGSAITALDKTVQVFQKGSEYFFAYIDASNNKLWPFKRGIAQTDRQTLSNGDTITMRQGNYIFLDVDGVTAYKTTIYPTFATTEPTSPSNNQWNFNTTSKHWERYSGSWSNMSAHWLGTVICDSSAAVASDSNDFNLNWKSALAGSFEIMDADTLRVILKRINVAGRDFYTNDFGQTIQLSASGDRETGVAENPNTDYYVYADNNLKLRFSTIAPRFIDYRQGLYHPKQYWRYLGIVHNDSGSNLATASFDGNSRSATKTVTAYPTGHHGSTVPVYASSSTITVAKIRERDSSDTSNITKDTSTTVDISTVGLNGIAQSGNLGGTITVSASGTSVGGSGTSFLTDFTVGGVITTAGGQSRLITNIATNTSMTVATAWSSSESSVTYKRGGRAPSSSSSSVDLFLYAITDGVTPGFTLSTRSVANGDVLVDLPAGYTLSSQLAFFIRLDTASSPNIIPFRVGAGWPKSPRIDYLQKIASGDTDTIVLAGGTATSFTAIDCSKFIPKICRMAVFSGASNTNSIAKIRESGNTTQELGFAGSGGSTVCLTDITCPVDGSQKIDYLVGSGSLSLYVQACIVTEVP